MTLVRDGSHRGTAALGVLAGLLTACVALGVAQLIAGIGRPQGSPLAAVGSLAIDHTPPAVKNFAIATFGSHDKTALVTGILVVLAVLSAGIGVAATRRLGYGLLGPGRLRGDRFARRADPAERRRGGHAAHPDRRGGWGLHAAPSWSGRPGRGPAAAPPPDRARRPHRAARPGPAAGPIRVPADPALPAPGGPAPRIPGRPPVPGARRRASPGPSRARSGPPPAPRSAAPASRAAAPS